MAINCKEGKPFWPLRQFQGQLKGKLEGLVFPLTQLQSDFLHSTFTWQVSSFCPNYFHEKSLSYIDVLEKQGKRGNLMPFGESHLVYTLDYFSQIMESIWGSIFFPLRQNSQAFPLFSSPRDMPTKRDWTTLGMECQLVETSYGNRVTSDEDISV